MRILKDFINDQVNLDNDYSNHELLALMYMSYIYSYKLYPQIFSSHGNLDSWDNVYNIIHNIQLDDKSKTFDTIVNVMKNFNIDIKFSPTQFSIDARSLLKKIGLRRQLDISLVGSMICDQNKRQYVFKINGKYVCRFNEIGYCPNEDNFYTMLRGYKVFYGDHYGKYKVGKSRDFYHYRHAVYCHSYCKIRLRGSGGGIGHPNDEIKHYKFSSRDEFEHSKKMFDNNKALFLRVFAKNLVKVDEKLKK